MTEDEFEQLKKDMKNVDMLLYLASNSKNDGTEAMKFAQAALNASDAINRKWLCFCTNRVPDRVTGAISGIQGFDPNKYLRQGY